MKFAHSFSEELQSNEYPSEWLDAAIRYRQLKKCIKKVQRELTELGLTADMLRMLGEDKDAGRVVRTTVPGRMNTIRDSYTPENPTSEAPVDIHPPRRRGSHDSKNSDSSGTNSDEDTEEFDEKEWLKKNQPAGEPESMIEETDSEEVNYKRGITFSYWFDGTLESFVPKLVFTVDSQDGSVPVNVNLAPETRQALEKLVTRLAPTLNAAQVEVVEAPPIDDPHTGTVIGHENEDGSEDEDLPPLQEIPEGGVKRKRRDSQQVLIPLSSDLEFFRTLTHEIASIDSIQSREEASITSHIVSLSDQVTSVSKPSAFSRSSDLYAWREIFQLYMEAGIFFSPRERDGHKQRTVEGVKEKMHWFQTEMQRKGIVKSFRNKKSGRLLGDFVGVNLEILRLLRFREINKTAMRKILKKFDKRTALTASHSFSSFIASDPFISAELAKALCYTMNERLLNIIPQLDDYLCPICSSIHVKPVRLNCSHIFCVRCLVKLQRQHQRLCPICRSDVVLQADSLNLDIGMLNFLKHYFPKEARIKQNENEKEVTMEQFRALQGQAVAKGGECCVM